ncbi:3-oxoacyl-(acyl-carrier protein) reductase [Agrobacterium tumefaciens str. Kerr 14]|uniref:3-oxoacyl-(Acyl-carrier protein) reductase n=1 Tax=Agrobacterium tumefaciens str. Kerr 14 TaxID=1183424 RepID=A0A1S7SAX1_AGRTU|nr:SDR family oxidoreductase [Agrobacterium tumefaciens]CUX65366.1 3-oxoacyl-(acyl-carrier protein) reductase [Agrobacterium tumefaciens str. Kerr 14]
MKIALVTGASRGLGAVIAPALALDGWAVAVNYSSDTAGADRVVEKIHSVGGKAYAAKFSAIDEEQIKTGVADIAERLGPIDLIVNNATGPQPMMPIMEQSWRTYLDQLEFFVKGPLALLQAVLPDWRKRKSGRVINIGSEIAELGNPEFGNYAAAKGAMLSMTRSWARELAPEGITCNLIAPGWIPVERHEGSPPSEIDYYLARTPMGHFGEPQDIADAVVFLASEKAKFITGQKLAVNGGRTLL